jgi:hypothetical protein
MAECKAIAGIIADPDRFLELAEDARKKGFRDLDAIMPYPVHGFEEKLGLKKSWVPKAAKTMLLIGALLGLLFQFWTSAISWPINVGGKPLFSWQAFVPIIFECGVLFAGITTFMAILHVARLYPGKNPKMLSERLTNDRFALLIPIRTQDEKKKALDFFKQTGVENVEEIDN